MARNYSAENERIKRQYFTFLREAKRYSHDTVDAVAKALDRFEQHSKHRDFRKFHVQQAVAFKAYLAEQPGVASGRPLSKATLHSTLGHLKAFFQWLAGQQGFKSRLRYSDAEYFNLGEKEARVAAARRDRPGPTVEQINRVLDHMPCTNEVEVRNRAVVAFTLLSGARDGAVASMKMKHLDLRAQTVDQDAREVNTKFSKSFVSFFFPVPGNANRFVSEWVTFLTEQKGWGPNDPLFPATKVGLGATRQFEVLGLERSHWTGATPIRRIFKEAFAAVGLPYFNPHSFRKTLATLAQDLCTTPEALKAWSQNLGHEGVLTTLYSYGSVGVGRQAQLMKELGIPARRLDSMDPQRLAQVILDALSSRDEPKANISS